MSYILEALKKSQRDRELGKVPDLATETFADSSEPRSGISPWIISSVVIALVALLIALYAVFGRQLGGPGVPETQVQDPMLEQPQVVESAAPKTKDLTTSPTQPQKPVSSTETEVKPATPAEQKIPAQAPRENAPAASSPIEPPPRQTEVEKIRQEYAQMQAREKQHTEKKQQPKPRPHKRKAPVTVSKPSPKTAAPVKNAYPAAHELPADVQARIPIRNIMLQSYSEDPGQRFVIMNSVKMHQGQSTADGLQVLEIRVDGLLLGFEGYEFFQRR